MTTVAGKVAALHVRLYRALQGRLVGRGPGGVPLILLTTTGRRSGQARTVLVGYVRHGDDLLVSPGSTSAAAPGWLHNVRTHPEAHVQLRDQQLHAWAEEPAPAAQEVLWRAMVAARPIYRLAERSRQAEQRRIPVVIRLRIRTSDVRPTPRGDRHALPGRARRRLPAGPDPARSRSLGRT